MEYKKTALCVYEIMTTNMAFGSYEAAHAFFNQLKRGQRFALIKELRGEALLIGSYGLKTNQIPELQIRLGIDRVTLYRKIKRYNLTKDTP